VKEGGGRRSLTGLLLFAVRPPGDGEVDLLAGRGLGLEGLLEAVPDQRSADVRVADVGHPRRPPEGHRCRGRRHLCSSLPLRRRRRCGGGEWEWGKMRPSHSQRGVGHWICRIKANGPIKIPDAAHQSCSLSFLSISSFLNLR
jgi:hypothetical protein